MNKKSSKKKVSKQDKLLETLSLEKEVLADKINNILSSFTSTELFDLLLSRVDEHLHRENAVLSCLEEELFRLKKNFISPKDRDYNVKEWKTEIKFTKDGIKNLSKIRNTLAVAKELFLKKL
jgi:hypothetical protein